MTLSVAFRADASRQIGGGHVMRCLTLADALREAGARCVFVCRALPGELFQAVRDRGHELIALPPPDPGFAPAPDDPSHAGWAGLPWARDACETVAALGAGVDWLALDHYAFDARWVGAVRPRAARVLAIDELDDRPLGADLLLDQSRLPSLGPRTHADCATALVGPEYALLRPEFARARAESLARRRTEPPGRRVLISTGMMDVGGAALAAARALAEPRDALDMDIDIAVSAHAPSAPALRALAERAPRMRFLPDAADMTGLMRAADLAIGAAGATTWERFCLGLPALLFCVARNQRPIIEGVAREGLGENLGAPGEMSARALRALTRARLADHAGLRACSERVARVCDGLGAARVLRRML